jgi:hypothetical protein
MASLFRTRELLESFPSRSVTVESAAIVNSKNDLLIRFVIDFGVNGRLARNTTIKIDPTDLLLSTKALKAYEHTLFEIIGMFEDMLHWVTKSDAANTADLLNPSPENIFNRVLCEEKPLMFHAVRLRKHMVFSMFGENLYDADIRVDYNQEAGMRMFTDKIHSLVDSIRDHLNAIEKLPMNKLLQGAK